MTTSPGNNAMHDHELKKLLLETCPIRPGQEERAWKLLQERLTPQPRWAWLYYPTWRSATVGLLALGTIVFLGNILSFNHSPSIVSAASQSPGIYATAFYSKSAKAQVVWLNGMEPATDKPTYMDPTTVIGASSTTADNDPNSL